MNPESKTATTSLYTNYCYNRLPCGVCRITNCRCPVYDGWERYPYYTTCGTATGTVAVFHENDNLKDCALNDNSQSGFDLISNNDTYVTIGGTRKSYCKVSCKDDFDIMYPTNRSGFAGQYFTLENYIPTVKIKRTCVTTELDYDGFKRDLNQLESLITSSTGANKTRYFNTYNDAIAKYKKCTEWIDDDSINMKNLKMKFSYDNDVYNLFGSGAELKKKSKDYTKDTKYWQGDLIPDNKYSNANSNKLVETIQVFNTTAGDKVNVTFTKNTYIKRTEEKS